MTLTIPNHSSDTIPVNQSIIWINPFKCHLIARCIILFTARFEFTGHWYIQDTPVRRLDISLVARYRNNHHPVGYKHIISHHMLITTTIVVSWIYAYTHYRSTNHQLSCAHVNHKIYNGTIVFVPRKSSDKNKLEQSDGKTSIESHLPNM